MKPHLPQRTSLHVHTSNYAEIRAYISGQIEQFLINTENWVLAEFRKLPAEPDPQAVVALNLWIAEYLPQRTIREMRRRFPD